MNCVHGTEITETCAHGETMKPNLNFRMQMSALTYMYISVAKITGIVCARRFQDLQNRNLKINLANKQTKMTWFLAKELHCLHSLICLSYNENLYSDFFLYMTISDLKFTFLSSPPWCSIWWPCPSLIILPHFFFEIASDFFNVKIILNYSSHSILVCISFRCTA